MKVIEYNVLVDPSAVLNVIEMIRHSKTMVTAVTTADDGRVKIGLIADKTKHFDGVGWNLEQSIPRWKTFGFEVVEVKVHDYV